MVRSDLSQAQQAVQGIHAAIEMARSGHLSPIHPHIVLCEVRDEHALKACYDRLSARGVQCVRFHEPDRDNELTAVATEPVIGDARKAFRKLKLKV